MKGFSSFLGSSDVRVVCNQDPPPEPTASTTTDPAASGAGELARASFRNNIQLILTGLLAAIAASC